MGRWQNSRGEWFAYGLEDLIRGDKVYCTDHGRKYIPAVVTRVKTVECATIVTIKKSEGMPCKHFVGFHDGNTALGKRGCVLTLRAFAADWAEEALEKATERSKVIAKRADALNAMRVLKAWLNQPEDEISDRMVE